MSISRPRVAILCVNPAEPGHPSWFSFGALRVQAALLASSRLPDAEVRMIALPTGDVDEFVARIEEFDPHVIGASVYVWSFPALVEVARRIRRTRPETLIVLGGRSARPAMFAHPMFADAREAIDALVTGEGEDVMVDIVATAAGHRERIADVAGVLLPAPKGGWRPTAPRPRRTNLDDFPSPRQMGLIPPGVLPILETYRGCPMKCAYCQDTLDDRAVAYFSKEYLERELVALRGAGAKVVQLIDPGLNMNTRAFRNLRDAERAAGLLKGVEFHFNVYPSRMSAELSEFLRSLRFVTVEVGVQSFNPRVLSYMKRPGTELEFEHFLHELTPVVHEVSVDLILGLPFDDPKAFLATLDRLLERSFTVWVAHCLVLPDTLATRLPPEANLRFEPDTLRMVSCAGWSEKALRETRRALDERVAAHGERNFVPGPDVIQWWFHGNRLPTLRQDLPPRSRRTPAR
jgi:radical SAM superfamily enzyme YgiQ (UPF0313 family)